jgi:hypothetical protein
MLERPPCRTRVYFSLEDCLQAREDLKKFPFVEFPDRSPLHGNELVAFLNGLPPGELVYVTGLENLRQRMLVCAICLWLTWNKVQHQRSALKPA